MPRYLDVRYNVTDLDDDQIGALALEAVVQAERSDHHPAVEVETETVDVGDDAPALELRRAALLALIRRHQQEPTDYDEGEEEDPRPYLDGREAPSEWVCVTANYSSHGSIKTFFLPTFDTARDAQVRATEYAHDDLFEELPVAVVNLDTGETYAPEWPTVLWRKQP